MEIFSSKSLTVAQYSRVNHVPDTNSINHQIFRVVACTNVTKVEMKIQNPFFGNEIRIRTHTKKVFFLLYHSPRPVLAPKDQ